MAITSVELNHLVFRYLQESGFTHAAFTLGFEADLNKTNIDANMVPSGALITFVQKGLQYLEMEANLNNSDVVEDVNFTLLGPTELITKDIDELQKIVRERKYKLQTDKDKKTCKKPAPAKEYVNVSLRNPADLTTKGLDEQQKVSRERKNNLQNVKDKSTGREPAPAREDRNVFIRDPMDLMTKDLDKQWKINRKRKNNLQNVKNTAREPMHAKEKVNFSVLKPTGFTIKDVDELQKRTKARKNNLWNDKDKNTGKHIEQAHAQARGSKKQKESHKRGKEHVNNKERPQKPKMDAEYKENHKGREIIGGNGVTGGPMDIPTTSKSQTHEFSAADVTILKGHAHEVCACEWNPKASLLASGSGDTTARLWKISDDSYRTYLQDMFVLEHAHRGSDQKNKDVTALDWNDEGTFLATGSYDGHLRIWNTNGVLKCTLSKHKGPVFTLKWNPTSEYVVTGSYDKTAILWDVKAEAKKQHLEFHKGQVLDVDWRDHVTFATSSMDSMVYVCKIGEDQPVKTFSGHRADVNCVRWNHTGLLLASCSDDATAKVWSMKQETFVHDLKEHTKELYTVRWSPSGPGSENPNCQLLLASGSCDSTVKLWDVEQGKVVCSLNGHRDAVYSLVFSPNGEYLASGSSDRCLHVWSVKEGRIVKTYTGDGTIFDISWNKDGNKIAAGFISGTISVLDFRM